MIARTVCLLFLTSIVGAAPVIRDVYPRGAQRGRTIKITVRGDGLLAGAQLRTTLPANISRLAPPKDVAKPDSELPFLVEIRKDAPLGFYPLRLVAADGISNVVLFAIGDLPETEEIESQNPKALNGTTREAQPLTVPVVVNGDLAGADVDHYSFAAKAGEKLVFEVEARRAGSAIDPAIEILDAAGRVMARNDDGIGADIDSRFEVSFAKAGQYYVRIHDSKYSDQALNFYRLKIGTYSYAEGIFPLGWRRGEPVEVSLLGGNAAPSKVKPDTTGRGRYAPIAYGGSAPMMFVLSDQPEILEPETAGDRALAEATIVNGRIATPGEVDRYRVAARPGEHWMFEIEAAALGTSQLDALLTVSDAQGRKLAARDDTAAPDPALPFVVPEGVNEIVLAIEDLLGRGGPGFGYRLQARRQPADFTLDLATPFVNVPAGGTAQIVVTMQRRGHDGSVTLSIPDLPPGFRVNGGNIPSEAAAQSFNNDNAGFRTARSVLTITAPDDASADAVELSVIGTADTPSGRVTRVARAPGMIVAVRGTGQRAFRTPWLEMGLPLAVTRRAAATLASPAELVRMTPGFEYQLNYRLRRASGARAVGRVRNAQSGGVGNIRILQGPAAKDPDAGAILVSTNFDSPITVFDMLLEATVEGPDGRPFTAIAPAVRIEIVPGFRVALEESALKLAPGGRIAVRGEVYREPTFLGGVVQLRAQDLPEGVRCEEVDVPASERSFTMTCQASTAVGAGVHEVRFSAAAPETGRANAKDTYKIPDVAARLTVGGTEKASR